MEQKIVKKIDEGEFGELYVKSLIKWEVQNQLKQFSSSQIDNLRNEKLELIKSLNINFEKDGDQTIVNCADLDLYGVGDTEQEAIQDLCFQIEDLYFVLKEDGEEKLGPHMLRVWKFMKKIIKEK
jgi:hypothetical protein